MNGATSVDYETIVKDLQVHRTELAKTAINHDGPWNEWDAVQRAIYSLQRAEAFRIQRAMERNLDTADKRTES